MILYWQRLFIVQQYVVSFITHLILTISFIESNQFIIIKCILICSYQDYSEYSHTLVLLPIWYRVNFLSNQFINIKCICICYYQWTYNLLSSSDSEYRNTLLVASSIWLWINLISIQFINNKCIRICLYQDYSEYSKVLVPSPTWFWINFLSNQINLLITNVFQFVIIR